MWSSVWWCDAFCMQENFCKFDCSKFHDSTWLVGWNVLITGSHVETYWVKIIVNTEFTKNTASNLSHVKNMTTSSQQLEGLFKSCQEWNFSIPWTRCYDIWKTRMIGDVHASAFVHLQNFERPRRPVIVEMNCSFPVTTNYAASIWAYWKANIEASSLMTFKSLIFIQLIRWCARIYWDISTAILGKKNGICRVVL